MRSHVKGLELWDIIELENIERKKDRQVMLILLRMVSNDIAHNLDVEKMTKQTQNTLKVKSSDQTLI